MDNKPKLNPTIAFVAVLAFILIIVLVFTLRSSSDDEVVIEPIFQTTTTQAIADSCLDPAGNSDNLKALIQQELDNPDSMEIDETRIVGEILYDINEDRVQEILIRMQYRAFVNAVGAFEGGVARYTVDAYIDQGCQIVEWTPLFI